CESIVNVACHPRPLFENRGLALLFSDLVSMCCHHDVMGQPLRQFDLIRAISSAADMLNTNKPAHFSQDKHRNSQELFTASFDQILSELCIYSRVVFDVVAHHGTLSKKHLLKVGACFPCLRIFNEWMISMRRDLLVALDYELQPQR